MPRIALISDTHNHLRPEVLALLAGCDHIVHGGDIGGPDILARPAAIAPAGQVPAPTADRVHCGWRRASRGRTFEGLHRLRAAP